MTRVARTLTRSGQFWHAGPPHSTVDRAAALIDEPSTGLDVAAREQLLATVDRLHRADQELATVLVTHHLEEPPVSTTHAMLVRDGQVLAGGSATDVLTTELVSEAFDYPIEIEQRGRRWRAHAHPADVEMSA